MKEPQLKEEDKVYLLRKNLKNFRLSKKLDHKKVDLFIIKKRKSKINYKLKLLDRIKIHPVFYISLLESADPRIPIFTKKLPKLRHSIKYKVEKIIKYNSKI